MRFAGNRGRVLHVSATTRLAALLAAVVALVVAADANAGASFDQTLHATTGFVSGGHILETPFSGTGNLPNVGAFSFTGEESDGCPEGLFCSKEFTLTLTARDGGTLRISGSWSVECISFDTGVPVSTGLCDNGLPTSVAYTVSGTGRFSRYHGSGTIGWSGNSGTVGMPVTLSLHGSLK